MLALLVALASSAVAARLLRRALAGIARAARGRLAWRPRCPAAMVHLPAPAAAAVVAWYGALLRWRRSAWPRLVGIRAGGRRPGRAGHARLSIWPWLRPGDGRAPRDVPRRRPGRRGPHRAAGGAAPPRRRRARRGPPLRRGRARARAVPLEPAASRRLDVVALTHCGQPITRAGWPPSSPTSPWASSGRTAGDRAARRRRWPALARSRAPAPRARAPASACGSAVP